MSQSDCSVQCYYNVNDFHDRYRAGLVWCLALQSFRNFVAISKIDRWMSWRAEFRLHTYSPTQYTPISHNIKTTSHLDPVQWDSHGFHFDTYLNISADQRPQLLTLQIPIWWDLTASLGGKHNTRRSSQQPTGPKGFFAKVLVRDTPGHLQMSFDQNLTGHSSFGRMGRTHSVLGCIVCKWS